MSVLLLPGFSYGCVETLDIDENLIYAVGLFYYLRYSSLPLWSQNRRTTPLEAFLTFFSLLSFSQEKLCVLVDLLRLLSLMMCWAHH